MAFTGNYTCESFKVGLIEGLFDFSDTTSDVFYIALYTNNASLDQSTAAYTTNGEVVSVDYTAGGQILTPVAGTSSAYVSFDNVSWAGVITARGALIYKGGSGDAICVLDFGTNHTSSLTFTVQFPIATAEQALIRLT